MNLNEIINKIKEVAISQQTVSSVYDGDVYENWNSSEVTYGSVNIGIRDITYESNLCTYSFLLYYGDRLLQDKNNVNSIITDGINTLQSIINILDSLDGIYIEEDITINYTPFEQKFMDYLAGVYVTVNIQTQNTIGICGMDEYDEDNSLIDRLYELITELREKNATLVEDRDATLELLKEIYKKLTGNDYN